MTMENFPLVLTELPKCFLPHILRILVLGSMLKKVNYLLGYYLAFPGVVFSNYKIKSMYVYTDTYQILQIVFKVR